MTITYTDPGEASKGRGGLKKNWQREPVPEEEITPRVAWLLEKFERPRHNQVREWGTS